MNTIRRATYRRDGGVTLGFPRNAALVKTLKSIPSYYRGYNPDTRTWVVSKSYADVAVDFLLSFFPDARIDEATQRPGRGTAREVDHSRVLHLRESAPLPLIEAAYRILARLHHPYVGGDSEAMRELNLAYGALKERVAS